jgi:cation diffusion facilitator family transporter
MAASRPHGAGAHDNPAHGHGDVGHAEHHAHDDGHEHDEGGFRRLVSRLGLAHGHNHGVAADDQLESSEKGIRTVKISLAMLGATAAFQIVVVIISGSVALLADTIHNFTDALTALPLWLAFAMSRRPASRRYTHGYGRAEDIAGVFIVLIIFASALLAGYESIVKLQDPTPLDNIEWVMVAAVIGFIGNEAVAHLRIRTGEEIGSAALVADGQHARVDGLTSLAVLAGAIGVLLGAPIADPIVGALITVAILFITKDAALMIWHRLLDATEPELLHRLEDAVQGVIDREPGARGYSEPRLRWVGHRLQAELILTVDGSMPTSESHRIAEEVRHELFHSLEGLGSALVHIDPWSEDGADAHEATNHHGGRR